MLERDGLQIPLKIYQPEDGVVNQIVLGVHGLGSSKESTVLAAIGEEMLLYHTATICFDFPAHGESPMSDRELRLENCGCSLMAVVEYAQETYPEVTDYGVFATSFGAYVTLLTLEALEMMLGQVKIVLRSPAVRAADILLRIADVEEGEFFRSGRVMYGFRRKLEIPYSLYEDLKNNPAMMNYESPMLILQGDEDDVVPLEDVRPFRRLNDESKLVIFRETDHRFTQEGEKDRIVDLTRDWFRFEKVLLDDWQ